MVCGSVQADLVHQCAGSGHFCPTCGSCRVTPELWLSTVGETGLYFQQNKPPSQYYVSTTWLKCRKRPIPGQFTLHGWNISVFSQNCTFSYAVNRIYAWLLCDGLQNCKPTFCLLANVPQVEPWGSLAVRWEGSVYNHFPTPVHTVQHASAAFPPRWWRQGF